MIKRERLNAEVTNIMPAFKSLQAQRNKNLVATEQAILQARQHEKELALLVAKKKIVQRNLEIQELQAKYHAVVNIGNEFKYKLDGDDRIYSGVISKIYPFANAKTRKIKAEVITTNFIVGLFGDGYITSKSE